MEKTILQQLFNGEIAPYDRMMFGNKDYEEINQVITDKREQLKNKLPACQHRQSSFLSVLPIQPVKGRVVFFRKGRKKISTLNP